MLIVENLCASTREPAAAGTVEVKSAPPRLQTGGLHRLAIHRSPGRQRHSKKKLGVKGEAAIITAIVNWWYSFLTLVAEASASTSSRPPQWIIVRGQESTTTAPRGRFMAISPRLFGGKIDAY